MIDLSKKLLPIFIFFFLIFQINAQDTINSKWGNGLRLQAADSSFAMKFSFRFQTLYDGRYLTETETWEEKMMIRRSRLKFDGYAVDPSIVYKVELGVSNRDSRPDSYGASGNTANIILDAVIKWHFRPGWQLWFGQTKLPGNRQRVVSSQKLQFVDRSPLNSSFTLDRSIGVQLRRSHYLGNMLVREIVAISTGEGRDIIATNHESGKEYTARLELLPFGAFTSKGDYFESDLAREQTGKLSIGLTYDYNESAARSRGNVGGFVTDQNGDLIGSDLSTINADAVFKYRGLSVTSEYAHRTSENKVDGYGYGSGFMGAAGYLFKSNFEVAARYTTLDDISDFSSITPLNEYTLGISKYVSGHSLKVQSDFTYGEVLSADPGDSDYLRFRLQCELAL